MRKSVKGRVKNMREKTEIMDDRAIARAVARIAYEVVEKNRGVEDVCVLGILTRGACLADRVAQKIAEVEGRTVPVGYLDIAPFRDDAKRTPASSDRSQIPFSVEGKRVLLVDDVIYTGRSIRAAIDAVMMRGRPTNIQLACLIDRGHREVPIRADYIGKNLPTSRNEMVRVLVMETDGSDRVVICADE